MKIQSKGPTIALWHESQMFYNVKLTRQPHYRYRLDYLTPIGQDSENLPAAPKIPPQTRADRKQAAEAYKVANRTIVSITELRERKRLLASITSVRLRSLGQSYKAVIHTLRWHAIVGSFWTTYRVSLNPNDNDFLDIKDGTN